MNHKDLDVWKKSMDLETIYKLTQTFPDAEKSFFQESNAKGSCFYSIYIAEGAARKEIKN
jgi:hypothetical protein